MLLVLMALLTLLLVLLALLALLAMMVPPVLLALMAAPRAAVRYNCHHHQLEQPNQRQHLSRPCRSPQSPGRPHLGHSVTASTATR